METGMREINSTSGFGCFVAGCCIVASCAALADSHDAAVLLEPDGTEWEDHTRLSLGTEAPCASFASFATVEEAKAIRPGFCSRRMCLDSETDWRFCWSRKPEERPVGFQKPGYDVSVWDVVKVPCSWQAIGINASRRPYDRPFYTNMHWPFVPKFPANSNCWPRVRGHRLPEDFTLKNDENPVGCYRRDFDIPEDWSGDEVFLEFGAVDSFFYLWVNGGYVGFSKSSRDPARFNVTRLIRPGQNTVALEVYRFSDGSYLESQDMFLLSGITRSVWAFHVPKTHLRDVFFTTSPVRKGDYAGDWKVDLATDVVGGKAEVKAHVFDAEGRELHHSGLVFSSPKLWSAECPNLYTLVLELVADGRTLEAAGFQLGFREVEIREAKDQRDRTLLLNGQPVKMRGVNRHESSPLYGHYTPDSLIEEDVKLIKQANCNHVRNSHYPEPDYFYYLCNRYGVYVMDEANVESHGFYYGKESISHVKSWEAAHVRRVMNMVERNKCHPSVLIWSLGNEAGPGDNFRACYAAAKRRDPSRPVQYERNNWITDMGARQYPTVEWMWKCAKGEPVDITVTQAHEKPGRELRYPYHVNEYAHNMGNAMGNLKDYQDAIESTTRICGAAIWDWVDQGLWHVTTNGTKILAYGGDFGDRPNAGAFVMNGCVLSDRTPKPALREVKHVFQPVVAVNGADGKSIDVMNRHYFRDLSGYECVLAHIVDGEEVSSRTFDLAAKPRETVAIPVSEPIGSYRLAFRQKTAEGFYPKGWTIADDQIDFTAPKVSRIASGRLSFGFSPETGELVSLKSGCFFRTELLKSPLTLDVFRAPVQNEWEEAALWRSMNLDKPTAKLVSFEERIEGDSRIVSSVVDYLCSSGRILRAASEWRIADGAATLKTRFSGVRKEMKLARIGWRTTLDSTEVDAEWLGRGPFENYSDRKSGAFLGLWRLPAADFFVPYDVPQDCGNREGTYRLKLDMPFDALTIATCGMPFAFEVSPYTPEELQSCAHPAELPPSKGTFVGIYPKVRGLGGHSCGPLPLDRDTLDDETYELSVLIK